MNQRRRELYRENPEPTRARNRRHREENAEQINAARRDRYPEIAPSVRARSRAWREQNPERAKALARRVHLADPSKQATRSRRWFEENRERAYAQARERNRLNPEARNERYRRRRARIAGATVERVDYRAILRRDGHWCYLCQQTVASGDVSFDHVVPISRGGAHSRENIRVTHLTCNLRKAAKLVEELDWIAVAA